MKLLKNANNVNSLKIELAAQITQQKLEVIDAKKNGNSIFIFIYIFFFVGGLYEKYVELGNEYSKKNN
jgi:hypothetical protein